MISLHKSTTLVLLAISSAALVACGSNSNGGSNNQLPPAGYNGVGGYSGGPARQPGDWRAWSCTAQNLDYALNQCQVSGRGVRNAILRNSDANLTFPVWLLWSGRHSRSMNLGNESKLCLVNLMCSQGVGAPNYGTNRVGSGQGGPIAAPTYDAGPEFDRLGNQGVYGKDARGRNNHGRDDGQDRDRDDRNDGRDDRDQYSHR